MHKLYRLIVPVIVSLAACIGFVSFGELTVNTVTGLTEAFPAQNQILSGSASSVSIDASTSRIRLYAQNNDGTPGRSDAAAYSSSSLSEELSFLSSPKTISINSMTMTMQSPGATYAAFWGLTSEIPKGGQIVRAASSIYFRVRRHSGDLALIQKMNGSKENVLAQWPLKGTLHSDKGNGQFRFSGLSLTVDGTSWSVSGTAVGFRKNPDVNIAGSGSFEKAITPESWGSAFYFAVEAAQTSASPSTAGRWAAVEMDSITAKVSDK